MKSKYLLPIVSSAALLVLLSVGLLSADLGTRIRRKLQTTFLSLTPHPNYVPTPPVAQGQNVSMLTPDETTFAPTPTEAVVPIPTSYFLKNLSHEYQTWNNCGPATLAMALSFYGIKQKQKDLAPYLKPDPEDKNVSPEDIMSYVRAQTTYEIIHVSNATLYQIKRLAANEVPVIIETWYEPHPNDGMGHYQLIQGYDEAKQEIYVNDSYKGPHIAISEQTLDSYWKAFNRSILVIYPKEKEAVVQDVLGDTRDAEARLTASLQNAEAEIEKDRNDVFAWFNLGTTYSQMGKHEEAGTAFDEARRLKLPWRMLWYQFEIFDSYLAIGRIQDVIDLTTVNLRQANNLEESYYYRAKAELLVNKRDAARADLQKAIKYNKNYSPAIVELAKL